MLRRPLRTLVLLALAAAVLALATGVAGLETGLLHLAPALLLVLPLLAGRYVGAEQLVALARARRRDVPRAAAALAARLPRAPRVTALRGTALLAASLAERGPPARLAAAR